LRDTIGLDRDPVEAHDRDGQGALDPLGNPAQGFPKDVHEVAGMGVRVI
jgi:hypothetical protein